MNLPITDPRLQGRITVREMKPKKAPLDKLITEDGVALAFAREHAGELLYCHSTGSWFVWSGQRWEKERRGIAFHQARELARELAIKAPDKVRFVASKTAFAAGVERFARTDPVFAVTAECWDTDPFLIATPGGTVDLKTGRLRRPDPSDRITRLLAVAPAAGPTCPRWLQFLQESTGGDQELIRFLQQWAGYSLTGNTREHALLFIHGPGGNGKSVFLNVLTGILADYATTASMDTFTAAHGDRHPTELAMLRGARLVTASETEEGKAWAEARIKQLTGGDPITARFMRQDFFTFTPTFKLMIVGNHKPALHSVDDAARRRFNIVPFTLKPQRPDPELETKLQAEHPGILRWMIDGCLDWQANGLSRPASVQHATDEYFDAQDVFGQWIDELCDAEPGNEHKWELSSLLFSSWADFAARAGERSGGAKEFAERMQRQGFQRRKKAQGARAFSGVRLKPNGRSRSAND
ncbi:phage/plasmid primase, P4 family [Terrihabitans sp. B22-R8]|uniref:phage/plasmid primase, P4 family n=1 Tax=Terrihabitans sp. B22-R8 TaxID=3425128 RepID=UPI00403C2495